MKKSLIVVDMQKDFVDGALGSKEAVAIIPTVLVFAWVLCNRGAQKPPESKRPFFTA